MASVVYTFIQIYYYIYVYVKYTMYINMHDESIFVVVSNHVLFLFCVYFFFLSSFKVCSRKLTRTSGFFQYCYIITHRLTCDAPSDTPYDKHTDMLWMYWTNTNFRVFIVASSVDGTVSYGFSEFGFFSVCL